MDRYLGVQALAVVRAAYALVPLLTSILLGLRMGSGAMFSLRCDEKNEGTLKSSIFVPPVSVAAVASVLNTVAFLLIGPIMCLLCVPVGIYGPMREYLWIISFGINAVFLYNYSACLLRTVGNSFTPLASLGISAPLNVGLDLVFVLISKRGVAGAGTATVVSQFVSDTGICLCTYLETPEFRINRSYMKIDRKVLAEIFGFSFLTYTQQPVMNFDISMAQGLVSSFDAVVMAASAAAVKIDSFTYMSVQDLGDAFSTFITQNYGVGRHDRMEKGTKSTVTVSVLFCLMISSIVCVFAGELMSAFVQPQEVGILAVGVQYLRIEGTFYCGIGRLFLLYGLYRAVRKPEMSVVLMIISLGTRVALAHILSAIPGIGVAGIWVSVPIGWFSADYTGFAHY